MPSKLASNLYQSPQCLDYFPLYLRKYKYGKISTGRCMYQVSNFTSIRLEKSVSATAILSVLYSVDFTSIYNNEIMESFCSDHRI